MKALFLFLFLLIAPFGVHAQTPAVVFNEIAWMGTTTSANDEWIELYNASNKDVDLTGWKIVAADGSPSITLKGEVLARGYFLLERTDDNTTPVLADMLYSGALSNDGEVLRLFNKEGVVVDEVQGWSGGDKDTKQTMARTESGGWAFGIINGTPGAQNQTAAPPAPVQKSTPSKTPSQKRTTSSAARGTEEDTAPQDTPQQHLPTASLAPYDTPPVATRDTSYAGLWGAAGAALAASAGVGIAWRVLVSKRSGTPE